MDLKYLNLIPYRAFFPIKGSQVQKNKKRKTTQYDHIRWGEIVPFALPPKGTFIFGNNTFDESQLSSKHDTSYYWTYPNQYVFWKNSGNHMILLGINHFDIRHERISRCGKYFIINTYSNYIYVYDIFKQLMFEVVNKEFYEILHPVKSIFPKYYTFSHFSDDFSKMYMSECEYEVGRKEVILCLASGQMYYNVQKLI
jgi:hypothetical protein